MVYKWGVILKTTFSGWDVPPRTLGTLEIFPLEKIYNGGIH